MTPEQAFDNVFKTCRAQQGTAEFHDVLRESLDLVRNRMHTADELEKRAADFLGTLRSAEEEVKKLKNRVAELESNNASVAKA
jgi:hypothetical protein